LIKTLLTVKPNEDRYGVTNVKLVSAACGVLLSKTDDVMPEFWVLDLNECLGKSEPFRQGDVNPRASRDIVGRPATTGKS